MIGRRNKKFSAIFYSLLLVLLLGRNITLFFDSFSFSVVFFCYSTWYHFYHYIFTSSQSFFLIAFGYFFSSFLFLWFASLVGVLFYRFTISLFSSFFAQHSRCIFIKFSFFCCNSLLFLLLYFLLLSYCHLINLVAAVLFLHNFRLSLFVGDLYRVIVLFKVSCYCLFKLRFVFFFSLFGLLLLMDHYFIFSCFSPFLYYINQQHLEQYICASCLHFFFCSHFMPCLIFLTLMVYSFRTVHKIILNLQKAIISIRACSFIFRAQNKVFLSLTERAYLLTS